MIYDYARQLYLPISVERLEAYRPNKGSDLEMVSNYYWNVCLCEALYPTLNAVEIALRNSIHSTLTNYYQTEYWFDTPNLLEQRQDSQLQAARKELQKHPRPQTAGKIVAELNFGFWVGMLNRPYESKIWSHNKFALLHALFPHATRKQRRLRLLRDRFYEINRLRNRVFHYEPVWNQTVLVDNHKQIYEAIGWISPTKRDSVQLFDRFPDVHQNGKPQIEQQIKTYLGIP